MLEEEEGSRWLSRTETLDSRLWDRLDTEDAVPGLWRERREEDRPSPNRGDNGKKKKKKEIREGGRRRGKANRGKRGLREGWGGTRNKERNRRKTCEVAVHHRNGI